MGFDDYLEFLSKVLLYKDGKNIVGDMGQSAFNQEDIGEYKKDGLDVVVRTSGYWDGLFYFTINPSKQTTSVYYIDFSWERRKQLGKGISKNELLAIFEGSENPFLRHENISFIGPFTGLVIPFINVGEFNHLSGYQISKNGKGEETTLYEIIRYSKEGRKNFIIPQENFRV